MRLFSKLFIFVMCVMCIGLFAAYSNIDTSNGYALVGGGYKGISINRERIQNGVEEVYLGGIPVGISLLDRGLVVVGLTDVITESGAKRPAADGGVLSNDIILEINGVTLRSAEELSQIVNKSKSHVILKIQRKKEIIEAKVLPEIDTLSKQKKLGIYVKEGLDGVGTLTYAREDKKRFGALGHAIIDNDTKCQAEINSGALYRCVIEGYNKGIEGKAGALKGVFSKGLNKISFIDSGNRFGLYGTYNDMLVKDRPKIKVGNRETVRPGKAYICTTISGSSPQLYEIEIIKTSYQNIPDEKSMVIRILDERLLATTGGIVQGMSGSPIIQNDKLVGAVTHVFINDPTKGYGLYIDWMLNN
ncbi:MAG: SpoIVB peptidase [Clostridia bacterium]|nr:SpoIVB peptidase [Clostridia bacterium]